MNKVIINQKAPERVDAWVIEELVKIAKDISIQSNMSGELQCYYTYKDSVDLLTSKYPNLKITGIIDYYIKFKDPVVQQIMIDTYFPGKLGILESSAGAVTQINSGLFKDNKQIQSFEELPKFTQITKIMDTAFNSSSIQSIDLQRITNIYQASFTHCGDLTSVGDLSNVVYLGFGAFGNCTNLIIEDLNCPNLIGMGTNPTNNINSGGNQYGTFVNTKLKKVSNLGKITTIPSGMAQFDNNRACFSKCSYLESVTLPETIEDIQTYSFYNCEKLTQCNFPESITKIGARAFYHCKLQGDLSLPNVTSIEEAVFEGNEFSNVDISNAPSVGQYAFLNCKNATFTLPEKLTSVGQQAFKGTKLSGSICIEGSVGNNFADETDIKYITATINKGSFANGFYTSNKTVTDIIINIDNITSRTNAWNTTANNSNLKRFCVNLIGTLHNQIYECPGQLFSAQNLQYVKVTCDSTGLYINGDVFNTSNSQLKTFIIDSVSVPNIPGNQNRVTLSNIQSKLPNMTIYVPDELYDNWVQTQYWSNISSIIKKISMAPTYNEEEL